MEIYDQDSEPQDINIEYFQAVQPQLERDYSPNQRRRQRISLIAPSVAVLVFGSLLAIAAEKYYDREKINLAALPAQLPAGIKRYIRNVGLVSNYFANRLLLQEQDNGDKNVYPYAARAYSGSGVLLNSRYVLTAGHMFLSGTNKPLINAATECEDLTFSYDIGRQELQSVVASESGSYKYNDSTSLPDAGLLDLGPNVYQGNAALPAIEISKQTLYAGEPLFFVNYEPTASGKYRDPINPAGSYTKPAIYGGFYIGKDQNGEDYDVLLGVKSYGAVKDVFSRPGASGGPVFNSEGQLVGIDVQGYDSEPGTDEYEQDWNVQLQHDNPHQKLETEIIQPITPSIIKGLETNLKTSEICR
jgi:hypothetical protein